MTTPVLAIEARLRKVDRDKALSCHEQIQRIIVGAVEDGILQQGMRLPAERRIAELAAVSRTTVRIALDTLVHQGLVEKRTGAGIFVCGRPRPRGIGCLLPVNPCTRPVWQVLLTQTLLGEIRGRLYDEAVYPVAGAEDVSQLQRDAGSGRIHGLVSTVPLPGASVTLPVVYCGLCAQNYCVDIDYASMVTQGVDCLVAQGCRELALLVYDYVPGQRRVASTAFQDALGAHDLACRTGRIIGVEAPGRGVGAEQAGRRALARLWDSRRHPDGIVCTDDWHGLGAMEALRERGVRIPQEVRLAIHETAGQELPLPCPATRLRVDAGALARAAVRLLEEVWAGTCTAPRRLLVAPTSSALAE